jgi:hypothetical protein
VSDPNTPERLVPFGLARSKLQEVLRAHAAVRFATADLRADTLLERAREEWWPMWLVDADGAGSWAAEVGFDVQVKSTDEELHGGRWVSRERMRTKIRWEPRTGTYARRIDNVPAPAMEAHATRWARLGDYPLGSSVSVNAEGMGERPVEAPDRSAADAWDDAVDGLSHVAADEVRSAAGAQHVRGFRLDGGFHEPVNTLLLLPVVTTWYRDDEGTRHRVWVHGVSGRVVGRRMASVRRGVAWGVGLGLLGVGILGIAAVLALAGLPLLAAGGLGIGAFALAAIAAVIALLPLVAALWPPLSAWRHNRREGAAYRPE